MLRLILARSLDGYLARGPDDDMAWTGPDDKAAFRLLTSVGAVCAAGSTTYAQMPRLQGRKLVCLSRRPGLVRTEPPVVSDDYPVLSRFIQDSSYEPSMTLDEYAAAFPEGWLLGGPTVALDALRRDLVGQVYLCTADVVLFERGWPGQGGIRDEVSPFIASRGERQNAGIPFRRAQRIRFGTTTVEAWSRADVCRSDP